ncbi:MAG: hypothetical protein BGO88_05385 [Flavobacterium sp. 38-13]|uniref:DUF5071 domain-containing protein n=1 Tax=Flavobacterium sp. 38-13 TaxID=1896168 RepID=UPI0009682A73|nr:DUF5071 domain-containing protein [Flavobacterium sp. 38-13]OJX50122.1 MAG: hypothetical protein BGO88_05385 [Flavobacterium sp. 38-13]
MDKDTQNLVPNNKEDLNFINNLKLKSISEIRDIIPQLLEWMQDMNWPQAPLIADYFSPYINEIQEELISILKSNDEIWKYWILHGLILHSEITPSQKILLEVKRVYLNASKQEKEEEVDVIAKEILEKYHIPF